MARSAALETASLPRGAEKEVREGSTFERSYLGVGLYSMSDAARLLRLPMATLRRWTADDTSAFEEGHGLAPLLRREDPTLVARGLLTFTELMELLLIRRLRESGMPLPAIRSLARKAAAALQTAHPFTTRRFTLDPSYSGGVMSPVLEKLVQQFDYAEDQLSRYWPLGKERRVVVDPARAFGRPTDPVSGVPTHVLYGVVTGGETVDGVARWYRVEPEAVRDAVEYEGSLAPARSLKIRHVQIRWLLGQWPTIEALAATAQPGDSFVAPQRGRVKKLETE